MEQALTERITLNGESCEMILSLGARGALAFGLPELADVLGDAVSKAVAGEVDVATIRDLVAYISFRLGTKER